MFMAGKTKVAQNGLKRQLVLRAVVKSLRPHCLETAMMTFD